MTIQSEYLPANTMNVLIIAFDDDRWGPVRLMKPLKAAGFRVATLSPAGNPIARSRYLDRHFIVGDVRSSRHLERRLAKAMATWRPRLIIPADERVVAWLHAVVARANRGAGGPLNAAMLDTIIASLGDPRHFDAVLMKSQTLRVARRAGVRTPDSVTVGSAEQALFEAARIGFPVYVKTSFSWAGQGVTYCGNLSDVATAMNVDTARFRWPGRQIIRALLNRDWYPTRTEVDVQQAIIGTPAMYCAVAVNGQLVAGFAGITRQSAFERGPSTIVWLGAHEAIEQASAAMVQALGINGFVGFDFIIESATDNIWLLECNPRPIQVCHLGERVGVDLCAALAARSYGPPASAVRATSEEVISLFPQEWQRDPNGTDLAADQLDVPWDDPPLLAAMISSTSERAAKTALNSSLSTRAGRHAMPNNANLRPAISHFTMQ
jgi:hypothetical protein